MYSKTYTEFEEVETMLKAKVRSRSKEAFEERDKFHARAEELIAEREAIRNNLKDMGLSPEQIDRAMNQNNAKI